MAKELIFSAKSVEEAVQLAAAELNVPTEELRYEVAEQPKKGLFGIGASDAVIRVSYLLSPDALAKDFITTLITNMGFDSARVEMKKTSPKDVQITIEGENLGLLIGHRGETLEAIQYLTNLAANKGIESFSRYTVDIENYRQKREETLRKLAQKMAAKVVRIGKNVTLEPMNAYERRIIHSEVQNIKGVTTFSVGSGIDRKIVVALDQPRKKENREKTDREKTDREKPDREKPDREKTDREKPDREKPLPKKPAVTYTYPGSGVSRQPIVKAKSIDDIDLADPDDTEVL